MSFDHLLYEIDWEPTMVVGENMVLYLIEENIYIDIKFTSWSEGNGDGEGSGGGFSYERSTAATVE
ncbi:MAG: hypothetical protein HRT66_04075 [Flavobacteriaceae bacterium]|nr:hypothetical protein [Flavobacteriaceae bacterium]